MKKWGIITDSSCDYVCSGALGEDICFEKVPFYITIGKNQYVDNELLNTAAMIDDMENFPEASCTACPSPGDWAELFEKAEKTIAITISSQLSGSYNSAEAARQMVLEKYPEKEIFVFDSRSAGAVLAMYTNKVSAWMEQKLDFGVIVSKLREYAAQRNTIFALSSFGNLVKNGRMSKLSGFLAGKLGIWGIGVASDEGKIVVKSRVKGLRRVLNTFIDHMEATKFAGGKVYISHCQNIELALRLRDRIIEKWTGTEVVIMPTGGLCSYYAERRGLIVGY